MSARAKSPPAATRSERSEERREVSGPRGGAERRIRRTSAGSPGLLLWRATLRWQRLIAAALKPLDLTHVQFVLLASSWWLTHVAGETPTQRRVAEHAGTDPMMTSQVLRTLEGKGLIRREAHPGDSRARLVGVTRSGAALAKRAIAVVEAADAEFFEAAGDQAALLGTLRRLAG